MINIENIPKQSGIYKITNKINNKVYIGRAVNLKTRFINHNSDYKNNNGNYYLYKAMKKYGIENFEVEILQIGDFSNDELNQMEIRLIELFKSNNSLYGYNLTIGGDGVVGYKHTEEQNLQKSIRSKGHLVSKETREKIRNKNLGKKLTKETREKMSKSKKGKITSEEHKQKLSESGKGRVVSKETRKKISKSHKGKILSQEHKEKMRKAKLGKKKTEQHIEKVVKSRKINIARKLIQESCCYEEYFYNDFVYKS